MSDAGEVNILIIDDERASQLAIGHVLDSEGWRMRAVALPERALTELATGEWTVVIANASLTGLSGPLFETLKTLAQAQAVVEGQKHRVRVLFLVPEVLAMEAQPALERDRLPYALKPLNLNDFLEKVSDLMLETRAIPQPLRKVKTVAKERRQRERRHRERRQAEMFAGRDDYIMTEEEVTEYEEKIRAREKEEERQRAEARKSLGEPKK